MSILAEAAKQKQISDVVESSKGMTLVNVLAVGKAGFFIGTPETATATLGTALRGLEVRVGKNVEWAEARAWRQGSTTQEAEEEAAEDIQDMARQSDRHHYGLEEAPGGRRKGTAG